MNKTQTPLIPSENLSTDGWGFVDGEIDTAVFNRGEDESESAEMSTRVVCIPECPHPSDVLDSDKLDLSYATSDTPLAGPHEDEQ